MSASAPSAPPLPIRLILGSSSPRRAQLLQSFGYTFTQHDPPIDDALIPLGDVPPPFAAEILAYVKAASLAPRFERGLILGCDTVIAHGGRRIGKPANLDDARRILLALQGDRHEVISAVAVIDAATQRRMLFTDTANVMIPLLPPKSFEAYLASDQWIGKAGGYNLAELEQAWSIQVTGDPTTVVGLPMRRLSEELTRFVREGECAA